VPRVGRYANPFLSLQFAGDPPPGTRAELELVETADRAATSGTLWLPAGKTPSTVLTFMHPRADFTRHYAVPGLLEAGYAVFCQNSRWVGNDSMLIHERVLFDVAAGMARLRARGFERIVAVGNSGGGSLYSLYQSQACAGDERIARTAAGDPIDLGSVEMPPVDAMVYLAAHPGEGRFLLGVIDPSVTDEADPCSCDPSLDLYDPENGFASPPQSSSFTHGFLESYRAAQRTRVERIDTRARALIATRRAARAEAANAGDDATTRSAVRRATAVEFMNVYRTEADPRCVDLSIDPSARDYGSLFGTRPDVINYGPFGFARVVTPEAWLSTWSGLSSHADTAASAASVDVPALVISYTADNAVFPADATAIFEALASKDKQRLDVAGDHYGHSGPGDDVAGRATAVDAMVQWLRERGY